MTDCPGSDARAIAEQTRRARADYLAMVDRLASGARATAEEISGVLRSGDCGRRPGPVGLTTPR